MRAIASILAALLLAGVVSGCSTGSQAVLDTALSLRSGGSIDDPAKLNPGLRYLRVTSGGSVALLVLGYVDPDPQGPIEVWYSAQRQVLKLQNGRLAGSSGLATEWRRVSLAAAPDWLQLLGSNEPHAWTRTRDVMPGYRYGIEDHLSVARIAPPDNSRYVGEGSSNLIWFEERSAPGTPDADRLPPARYALDPRATGDPVVYGEACLSKELCITWQRWPVAAPGILGAR